MNSSLNCTEITPAHKIFPVIGAVDEEPISNINQMKVISTISMHNMRDAIHPLSDYTGSVTKWKFQDAQMSKMHKEKFLPTINESEKYMDVYNMGFWEVYSNFMKPEIESALNQLVQKKAELLSRNKRPPKDADYTLTTVHLGANSAHSILTLQKLIKDISVQNNTSINWSWKAAITGVNDYAVNPNGYKSLISETGDSAVNSILSYNSCEGALRSANIRSYRNQLKDEKRIRWIIGDNITLGETSVFDCVTQILYATLQIANNKSASAIIKLSNITPQVLSAIGVFANCFLHTYIYTTVADDSMFLVGIDATLSLTAKQQDAIYNYIDTYTRDNSKCMSRLNEISGGSFDWEKIVQIYDSLAASRVEKFSQLCESRGSNEANIQALNIPEWKQMFRF